MIAFVRVPGAPQQQTSEASITYKLQFSAEQGVSTRRHLFRFPSTPAARCSTGLVVADGGTVSLQDQANEGRRPRASTRTAPPEAHFTGKMVKGFGDSMGPPDVTLSMQQPDAGLADMYLRVNKGRRRHRSRRVRVHRQPRLRQRLRRQAELDVRRRRRHHACSRFT